MSNRPRVPTVAPQLTSSERVALAGVTAALALAAAGALVVVPARSGAAVRSVRPPQVAAERLTPAAPTPAERQGRVLARVSDVEPLAVAADPANPARLQVVLPSGPRVIDCNVVRPTVTVTEQTEAVVRLVVSGYEWVPKDSAASGGTTCVTAGATAVPVALAAPLGDRHAYVGSSPTATVVADPSDLPAVADPPAGYRQVSLRRAQPTAGRLVGERTYASGADRLVVRVGAARRGRGAGAAGRRRSRRRPVRRGRRRRDAALRDLDRALRTRAPALLGGRVAARRGHPAAARPRVHRGRLTGADLRVDIRSSPDVGPQFRSVP